MTLLQPIQNEVPLSVPNKHRPGVLGFSAGNTPSPVHCFESLLSSTLNIPSIVYVPGHEGEFRQAVVAPVVAHVGTTHSVAPRPGSLLNLLVERSNGQLLTICILDNSAPDLDLIRVIKKIDALLSVPVNTLKDIAAFEVSLSNAAGCTVTIEESSFSGQTAGFFSNAIEGLARTIVKQVATKCGPSICMTTQDPVKRVIDCLNSQLRNALSEFSSNFDQRIVRALVRSGVELTTSHYNQYRRLGKAALHRRLQAAEAFPLIGAMQIECDRKNAYLRRAIDLKMPLTPALSKGLGVHQEVIRWLMGKDIDCVGRTWSGRLIDLAKSLALVCPEHRPLTSRDWTAFADFEAATRHLDRPCGRSSSMKEMSIAAGLMQQIGKIGWSRAVARLETLGATVSDLTDVSDLIDEMVQVLAEQIGEGSPIADILHDELQTPLKTLYFSGGLTRQLKASLRWHQLMLEQDDGSGSHRHIVPICMNSWPTPFDGCMEVEGLNAVCLTNPQQLKEEGELMQHCVRNYADYCLYYGSTILSLRTLDGRRLSTVELSLTVDSSDHLRFSVRQHRGFKNAQAPQQAINALQRLLPLINGKGTTAHRQHLYRLQNERKAFRRDRSYLTLDPRRIEILKRALQLHVGYERFYDEALKVAARL